MKFVSKQSNYTVVLRPGIPGERITGRAPVAGLYVHFSNGVSPDIKDEEMLQRMMSHPLLGRDFILMDGQVDPYADTRKSVEPEHNIMEMNYGAPGKNLNPKPAIALTPEQKRIMKEMATQMAQEIAIPMGKQIATDILKQMAGSAGKNKPGRPPKIEKKETIEDTEQLTQTQEPEETKENE